MYSKLIYNFFLILNLNKNIQKYEILKFYIGTYNQLIYNFVFTKKYKYT